MYGAVADGRIWRQQLQAVANDFIAVAWDEPGAVLRARILLSPPSG